MARKLTEKIHEAELALLTEHVYSKSGFDFTSCSSDPYFDPSEEEDVKAALAMELDRLLRKTWVLAGGDPERFSYPSYAE